MPRTIWRLHRKASDLVTRAPALSCAALVIAALAAMPHEAAAQVLYKWVDSAGRTQYSDTPPKNFAGPVTRIEPDEKPTSAPAAGSSDGKAANGNAGTQSMIDMAAKKRAVREGLEANLNAARARLAEAKAALDGSAPGTDERQTIQVTQPRATALPGPKTNCVYGKDSSGTRIQTCRSSVPTDAYYDRNQKLQDAVKSAEDDVAAAEQAYRRGVD